MRLSPLAATVAVALALAGCSSDDGVRAGREQALALVGQYAPQLAVHKRAIDGLQLRLRSLPPGSPGVAELSATLDRDLTAITAAQAVIDQVPGQAAEAARRGRAGELRRLTSATAETVASHLITIANDVADVTLAVNALEDRAAAAAIDAGPGDAGAGAALDAGPGDAAAPRDAR